MLRRTARIAAVVAAVVLPLIAAESAAANVTGVCEASQNHATIDGVRYTPNNDTPDNPVLVPDREGVIVPYMGRTTVATKNHSGYLEMPFGPTPVEVADWSHPNEGESLKAKGNYALDEFLDQLPFDITGLYRVNGYHSGEGGSCDGFALVKFEGDPLSTPIGAISTGASIPLLFLIFFAGFLGSRLLGASGGLLFGLTIAVVLQQFGLGLLDNFAIFGLGLLFLELGKWMGSAHPFGSTPEGWGGPGVQGGVEQPWDEIGPWTRLRLWLGFFGGKDPGLLRSAWGHGTSGMDWLWFGLFALLLAGGLGVTRHLEYGLGEAIGYALTDPFTYIVFGTLAILYPLLRMRAFSRWGGEAA